MGNVSEVSEEKKGELGNCQVCNARARLVNFNDRDGGFLIARICRGCFRKLTGEARGIRAISCLLVYGLRLNPKGGTLRIGRYDYNITRIPKKERWNDSGNNEYDQDSEGESKHVCSSEEESNPESACGSCGGEREILQAERRDEAGTEESEGGERQTVQAERLPEHSVQPVVGPVDNGSSSAGKRVVEEPRKPIEVRESADLYDLLGPEDPGVRGRARSSRKVKP